MVIALAGNKADLESRRKVDSEVCVAHHLRLVLISIQEARQYALDNDILHLETSAKTANNVQDLFVAIAKRLPKNLPQQERETFPITPPITTKQRGCC